MSGTTFDWLGDRLKSKDHSYSYQAADSPTKRLFVGETITYLKRNESGKTIKGTCYGELVAMFEEAATKTKFAVITPFLTIKDVQKTHAPALNKLEDRNDDKEIFYSGSKATIRMTDVSIILFFSISHSVLLRLDQSTASYHNYIISSHIA